MTLLHTIRSWFESLEERTFRNYLLAAGGALFLLSLGIIYYHYRSVSTLIQSIDDLNEERTQIRTLLSQADRVKRQKELVRKMLEENIVFKITGYLGSLLDTLGLSRNAEPPTSDQSDENEQYRETTASTVLTGISMREVAHLLQELEKKGEIYLKELVIERDKKRVGTIKVALTIGTLVPKTSTGAGRG